MLEIKVSSHSHSNHALVIFQRTNLSKKGVFFYIVYNTMVMTVLQIGHFY